MAGSQGGTALIASDKSIEAAIRRGIPKWYGVKGAEGLRLRIAAGKRGVSAVWILKYKGKALGGERSFGLGAYPAVSLKAARVKAAEYMALCRQGIDPRERRDAGTAAEQESPAETVGALMGEWLDYKLAHGDWKNDKRRRQEGGRMERHALPQLGGRPVDAVTPADVVDVLRPIWNTPTGEKVAINLKGFFQWVVTVKRLRQDNPATSAQVEVASRGTLPKKQRSKRGHPFLLPEKMPGLMAAIVTHYGDSYAALALNILTAQRSGEMGALRWDWITELDGGPALVFPAKEMKKEENGTNKVPLSAQAVDVLRRQRQALEARGYGGPLVFPGNTGRGVSSDSLRQSLIQLHMEAMAAGGKGYIDEAQSIEAGRPVRVDVHGVSRASFETWAREHHRELGAAIDLCLHHKIDPRYEAAYNRYEYMKERRQLLQGWADYLLPAGMGAKR